MSRRALFTCLFVGLLTRLYWWHENPGVLHPDEIYQYLEPAYWKMHGMGIMAWEYARGARSWLLPSFYGAWLTLGEACQLRGVALWHAVQLHNIVLSLWLIVGTYALAWLASAQRAGVSLLCAACVAGFAPLALLASTTLSETYACTLWLWCHVLWLRQIRTPAAMSAGQPLGLGVLLGLCIVLRPTFGILVPIIAWDLWQRERHALRMLGVGLTCIMALMGLSDLITWGTPFHALREYIEFNLQGGQVAGAYGAAPWYYYLHRMFVQHMPLALPLLGVPLLWAWRTQWRLLLTTLVYLVAMSALAHKEERFCMHLWPIVWVAGLCALQHSVQRLQLTARHLQVAAALVTTALLVPAWYSTDAHDRRSGSGVFRALSWIGAQQDASGALYDVRGTQSYLFLQRQIPLATLTDEHLQQSIFNYVIVHTPQSQHKLAAFPAFESVWRDEQEGTQVLRRR